MRHDVFGTAFFIGVLSVATAASAHTKLPPLDGKATTLELKIVRYTGGTNGEMIVEVKNPTKHATRFSPKGLYFVPDGDPERAPQRLGAAGPFLVAIGDKWQSAEVTTIAPKAKSTLKLQVFCIDSHRASPTAQHSFRLGSKRLPKVLRAQMEGGAKRALTKYRAMPAAKSEIQGSVWRARDAKWIKLDGERSREKDANPKRRHYHRRMQRTVEPLLEPIGR